MLIGSTGAGKSSTVNALVGSAVANVGYGVNPETMDIKSYKLSDKITLWDTPGLGDSPDQDEKHLEKIKTLLNESYFKEYKAASNENEHIYHKEGHLIDIVLVILDGSSRDLGTIFKYLKENIYTNIRKENVLFAINQADVAMSGKHFDNNKNMPDDVLSDFLTLQSESFQKRIEEYLEISIDKPFFYSAEKGFNIDKLITTIKQNTIWKSRKKDYFSNLICLKTNRFIAKCQKCGKTFPKNIESCDICGEKLTLEDNVKTCPDCKIELPNEASFCFKCGIKIETKQNNIPNDFVLIKGNEKIADFYICKYEVTQGFYKSITGKNPSYFKGDNRPVENISWNEAVKFCNELSKKYGRTPCYSGDFPDSRADEDRGKRIFCDFNANGFRLPTKKEWDFAAGSHNHQGEGIIDYIAWYKRNSGGETHPVGQKAPNQSGLYDMCGNVEEWLWDSNGGWYRDTRGGMYNKETWEWRMSSAVADFHSPNDINKYVGFRLVCSAEQPDIDVNKLNNSNCFITTATCKSRNLPDDCHELTSLRHFRDTFMKKDDEMKKEVEEYYDIAPKICSNIDNCSNSTEIYENIWQTYLKSAVNFVDSGENEKAHSIYKQMVLDLKEKYLNK